MLNLKTFSIMTIIYKYYIRYYKTTKKGRKVYYNVESPAYAFRDICHVAMQNAIRNIVSNPQYTIDSYHIESVLLESVVDQVIKFEPDTSDLPFLSHILAPNYEKPRPPLCRGAEGGEK